MMARKLCRPTHENSRLPERAPLNDNATASTNGTPTSEIHRSAPARASAARGGPPGRPGSACGRPRTPPRPGTEPR
jgi:hypothetical protein